MAAAMFPIQAPLWALTGRPLMSACHTLSTGRIGHAGAVGGALAAAGTTPATANTAPSSNRRRTT